MTTLTAAMLEASGRRAVAAGNIGRAADRRGRRRRRRARRRGVVVPARVRGDVPAARRGRCSRSRPTISTGTARFDAVRRGEGARSPRTRRADDLLVFDADDADASRDRGARRRRGASAFSRRARCDGRVPRRRRRARARPTATSLAAVGDMRRALRARSHERARGGGGRARGRRDRRRACGTRSPDTRPCPIASRWSAKLVGCSGTTTRRRRTPTRPCTRVASFDSVVLLAGGRNKGLDLSVLAGAADRIRGVVAFGEAAPEVARAFAGVRPGRDGRRLDARRRARRRRAGAARRRRAAVAGVRVVRRVRGLRRAGRRLRGRGPRLHRAPEQADASRRTVTAITPRIVIGRISQRTTRTRAARAHARDVFPRPPTYVVLCATVAVLNIVGLVMILSASSVAALSDYGSSWYFFNRQLVWALVGVGRVRRRVARRLPRAGAASRRTCSWSPSCCSSRCSCPGVGIVVDGSRRWLGVGPLRVQPSEIAKLALLLLRRRRARAPRRLARRLARVEPGARRRSAVLVRPRDARARPRLDDRARAHRGRRC